MTDVIPAEGKDEEAFLSLIGSVEKQSEHPLAQAIVKGIEEKGIAFREAQEFEAIPGYGCERNCGWKRSPCRELED